MPMRDLEKAKALLRSEGYTCVLCRDDLLYTSYKRGVAPLMELLDSGEDLSGFSAADKVVGKATALLYRLLNVRCVYGAIISESALHVLQAGGIAVFFETTVDHIVNRTGDGRCPMETATAHISDPAEAPDAIRAALSRLQQKTR